jgi:hypothetical protein
MRGTSYLSVTSEVAHDLVGRLQHFVQSRGVGVVAILLDRREVGCDPPGLHLQFFQAGEEFEVVVDRLQVLHDGVGEGFLLP